MEEKEHELNPRKKMRQPIASDVLLTEMIAAVGRKCSDEDDCCYFVPEVCDDFV